MTETAEEIAQDYLTRRAEARLLPAEGAAARVPDLAGALSVQAAIEARLTADGARPIGWKIGATSQVARDMLGVNQPFRGRLFDRTTCDSGGEVPRGDGVFQVWEVEIALRIGADLDPGRAPFSADEVRAATAAMLPAIEIVGSAWVPFNKAPAFDLIADNAVHGHWIRGAEMPDWSGMDLDDGPIRLILDGAEQAAGRGANVDGGPFGSTAWLANHLAESGLGLRVGEYVTTGTVTPLVPIGTVHDAVADFGPLGSVSVTLV